MGRLADQANSEYHADRPQAIAPVLADGLRATRALMEHVRAGSLPEPGRDDILFELRAKESQFEHALEDALGTSLLAVVAPERELTGPQCVPAGRPRLSPSAFPGRASVSRCSLPNQSPENVSLEDVSLAASDGKSWKFTRRGEAPKALAARALAQVRFAVSAPADAALTRPYFTRPDEEQPYYDLTDARYRNLSFAPYPLLVHATVVYRGVPLHLSEVVQAMHRVQAQGIIPEPLIMGPAISLWMSPDGGSGPADCAFVQLLLYGSQQRQRTGSGNTAAEAAFRLAFYAGIGRVFHGS